MPSDKHKFPANPRVGGHITNALWVITNDYRPLSPSERRNVVYPGKRMGYIDQAPRDHRGVRLNDRGETSVCGFVLTEKGRRYYETVVLPKLPDNFTSEMPKPPARHSANANLSTAELKRQKQHS